MYTYHNTIFLPVTAICRRTVIIRYMYTFYSEGTSAEIDTSVVSMTTSSATPCVCSCPTSFLNPNDTDFEKQLNKKLDEIKTKLVVNKTDLSSEKRKKISAPDERVSSQSIGSVGAVLLAVVVLAVVVPDLIVVLKIVYFKCSSLFWGHHFDGDLMSTSTWEFKMNELW